MLNNLKLYMGELVMLLEICKAMGIGYLHF